MSPRLLPADDPLRLTVHDEVHARPPTRVHLPALITYLAVLHDAETRAAEADHLRRLPGQENLRDDDLAGQFLRLRLTQATLKWERHAEFTRYTLVQPLPDADSSGAEPGAEPAAALALTQSALPNGWWAAVPGRTIAAIRLVMTHTPPGDVAGVLAQAQAWLGGRDLVASVLGTSAEAPNGRDTLGARKPQGHSMALTRFVVEPDGFERMLVYASVGTSPTRAGRIAARLLELETYRLMALRGLPVAKALGPSLGAAESALAQLTAQLGAGCRPSGLSEGSAAATACASVADSSTILTDAELLDRLVQLAAQVEQATAAHAYRFAATQAYHNLVKQRIAELREAPIPGTQMLGEFMSRRLSPAMATVAATAQRLTSLSERIARASDLLRTRVNIATEAQNQQLLEQLAHGQATQLRLQSTVEGLSIAAISYYVVSLLLYGGKALKGLGVPINPELVAGGAIPLVLWAVWRTVQRIHARLGAPGH